MAVTLSKNEIRARAAKFAADWQGVEREEAEAQSFQEAFFRDVLGVDRRKVATFEKKVKCLDGGNGYIDLFWKGHILIEMKTLGKDRRKAYEQALRYTDTLKHGEMPHAILICDFEHWDFYDLDKGAQLTSFTLAELPEHIDLFFYLAGYEQRNIIEEDPVNVQAAELMGQLHDCLRDIGYTGHALEVYLVRLLFCLFADDTGIFERNAFHEFLTNCTAEDGRDLAPLLAEFFQVLNTPEEQRLRSRNETLLAFPYVNGKLFAEMLPMPAFDTNMREILLRCSVLDWGKISPAIFGSMFQSVMKPEDRRALGAHYTSERNILKLINPLFMDALRAEFENIRVDRSSRRRARLGEFHTKLSRLTFLDPACGCGNFLVVAYRELRLLEMEVIKELDDGEASLMENMSLINVDQFYGIEIEEFPAHIAQVAMWLMDHQMNVQLGRHFGKPYVRIPLRHSAAITCGNALRIDWESIVPKEKLSYILGNPPFVGYTYQSAEQKEDMRAIFAGYKVGGKLDFVSAWYKKAAEYMQGTSIRTAFVSTNSITQGEQAVILWQPLMEELGVHIDFAHRTFKWSNEGRNNAAVHCVIIGYSVTVTLLDNKFIYAEDDDVCRVSCINSYLVDAPAVFIENRSKPLCPVPEIRAGNRPADGGCLIIEANEYEDFLNNEPQAARVIKPFMGSEEFINGSKRWCLWLKGVSPAELRAMPLVMQRVEQCREDRLSSPDAGRRKLAATPTLFRETVNPESLIAIPKVSSERR